MRIPVTIQLPNGNNNAPNPLSQQSRRELNAFLTFALSKEFLPTIAHTGHHIDNTNSVSIELLINEDPPDIQIKTVEGELGVEVTEYPPHSRSLEKAAWNIPGAHSEPFCSDFKDPKDRNNPKDTRPIWTPDNIINQTTHESRVRPNFKSPRVDERALIEYLDKKIKKKDGPQNQILLLYGGAWANYEVSAIRRALNAITLSHLKAIVYAIGYNTTHTVLI